MTTEKITTRMGSTTVTQTTEGFELKTGSGIKIPPIVSGGGMFDPKVDSWQEEEYDVPMGKSRRKNNNINKM